MKKRIISIFVAALLLVVLTCCMGCDNITGGGNSTDDSGSNGGSTDDSGSNGDGSGGDNESNINMIYMAVGSARFEIKLYDGATADAFVRMLPLALNMSDMAHEKYYNLPTNLPTSAERIGTILSGDIMLWGSNCLVLFYESFSSAYSYTRIGRIEDTTGLAAAVGSDTEIVFALGGG